MNGVNLHHNVIWSMSCMIVKGVDDELQWPGKVSGSF
jgi:hypothetical protein